MRLVAAQQQPVDIELGKPRRGEGFLRLLIIGVAVVAIVAVSIFVAFRWPSDRNVDASSEVTIGQVDRVAGQSPIAVPVTVRNTTDDVRDYVIDVDATSPDGATFYATSGTLIQRVEPGATGSGSVGFFGAQDIPMDAEFVVSEATGYKDCPNRSSGRC